MSAEITLIDARPGLVQRIRLHEAAVGGAPRTLEYRRLLERRGVTFRRGTVDKLDADTQQVHYRDPDGTSWRVAYDWLVLALGSRVHADPVTGAASHTHRLDGPEQAAALRGAIERGRRLLVVGGGAGAVEAASELAEHAPRLAVELVCAGPLMPGVGQAARDHVRAWLGRAGVSVIEQERVAAVEANGALLQGGAVLPFDSCLWAGGFQPAPLARAAGLAVNPAGQARTDPTLRSLSHPNVFVAGDCGEAFGPDGKALRMSCATAMPMGAQVAENLTRLVRNRPPRPFNYGYTFLCVSLGRRDGVIQFLDRTDRPSHRLLTGRSAARFKESICRLTVRELQTKPGLACPSCNG